LQKDRPLELENITRTFDHTLAEYVALVAQQPLDFLPGSKWTYSSHRLLNGKCIRSVASVVHAAILTPASKR
jgi:hypothetical protein